MQNETVATTRTVVNTTILTWAVYLVNEWLNFGIPEEVLIAGFPFAVGIFHRASLVLSEIWPPVGYVLFGIPRTPVYPKEAD